jgi:hypothetical protein
MIKNVEIRSIRVEVVTINFKVISWHLPGKQDHGHP